MKKSIQKITFTLAALLLLSACQSTQRGVEYGLSPEVNLSSLQTQKQNDRTLAISRVTAPDPLHTRNMEYTRSENQLEYFADNRWSVAPARMVQDLFFRHFLRSNSYGDVIALPSDLKATHRLDLNLLTMRQYFTGRESYVEVELHARLINNQSKRSYFSRQYYEREPATELSAKGGVDAYNRAFARIIERLIQDVQRH